MPVVPSIVVCEALAWVSLSNGGAGLPQHDLPVAYGCLLFSKAAVAPCRHCLAVMCTQQSASAYRWLCLAALVLFWRLHCSLSVLYGSYLAGTIDGSKRLWPSVCGAVPTHEAGYCRGPGMDEGCVACCTQLSSRQLSFVFHLKGAAACHTHAHPYSGVSFVLAE